jgi:uroporphyrinogen decarboxylase
MLYGAPEQLHRLLAHLTRATTDYLTAQIHAGAQAVMVFDTWGGALSPAAYREFSLRYMQQIVSALPRERDGRRVPVVLFTKGGGQWLADRVALQGNLDPSVLYAPPAAIRTEVSRVLESYGHGHGHVFNLGHGIHPDVPPEHAAAMVEAVHELSPRFHV